MKILLFGKNGQVGWELQRSLAPLGDVIALGRDGASGLCGNLVDHAGLADTVRRVAPRVIVNAGAYTAVDKAESDVETAFAVNGQAPGVLAREAARLGAWLVHYSTDYVYSGEGTRPWTEENPTGPLSVYGKSKLAGDEAVAAAGGRYLIFRVSWVYGVRGNNFIRTMLRLAQTRDTLKVVNDQFGAPTGAELIADVTAHAVAALGRAGSDIGLTGIYHLAAAGETSWWEYARLVLTEASQSGAALKVQPDQVAGISSDEYPVAAPRPRNSRLSLQKLESAFALKMPDWRSGVLRAVREMVLGGGGEHLF